MESNLNILVIEDDPADSKAICRILARTGVTKHTDTACSLQEAKEKMWSESYDAMILDLGLPDCQGIDAVLELQACAPELPIVVVTGNEDEKTALKSINIGAEDFISKNSLNEENLPRALRFAIERHQRKNQVFGDLDTLRLSLGDAMRDANTDVLTGFPNRRGLNNFLEQLSRSSPNSSVIVGVADVDRFKSINDAHGHNVGDLVLREFASRLQQCLSVKDFAARIGGDEFVVVFCGVGRAEASLRGERMISRLAEPPLEVSGKLITFSATLALAEIEPPFIDLEQILLQTHAMLSRGKQGGRGRVECAWAAGSNTSEVQVPGSSVPAEAAANEGELFQHVRSVRPFGAAGLIGHHLTFGAGPASGPMAQPAVSRARLANRLPEMTLQCMRRAQEWREHEAPQGELHLDIEADGIKPWMAAEMTRIFPGEKSRESCVLFVHSDFNSQPGAVAMQDLRLLKQAGFKVGVRNVGNGSTVLEHLLLLRPDWIRLDSSLTINVGHYEKKAKALRIMVEMLKPLNALFAAEGTEAEQDLQCLLDIGFHAFYSELTLSASIQSVQAIATNKP